MRTFDRAKQKNSKIFVPGFEMACISDTGAVRAHNEDNFCFHGAYMPKEHQSLAQPRIYKGLLDCHPVAAVFDGMGGESLGELASYEAAVGFSCYVKERNQTYAYSGQELKELLQMLNDRVVKKGREEGVRQVGTTASVLALEEKNFLVANLGDSPVYLIRKHGIRLLSRLHTNEEALKAMALTHRKPGLTQFLGIPREEFCVEPYICQEELEDGDLFLICSDGLTDMVSQGELMGILLWEAALDHTVLKLKELALEHGGRDNITIILCRVAL